nr:MAG TPA: hypothetical protein [Caudoviricetes sp.]
MNEKVNKLLADIDAEVLTLVNAEVTAKDAEIKARAKAAYDKAIEDAIADIKSTIDAKYEVARKYLESLKEPEEVAVAEEPIASEPVSTVAKAAGIIL